MHNRAFISYCILQSAVAQLVEQETGDASLRLTKIVDCDVKHQNK